MFKKAKRFLKIFCFNFSRCKAKNKFSFTTVVLPPILSSIAIAHISSSVYIGTFTLLPNIYITFSAYKGHDIAALTMLSIAEFYLLIYGILRTPGGQQWFRETKVIPQLMICNICYNFAIQNNKFALTNRIGIAVEQGLKALETAYIIEQELEAATILNQIRNTSYKAKDTNNVEYLVKNPIFELPEEIFQKIMEYSFTKNIRKKAEQTYKKIITNR